MARQINKPVVFGLIGAIVVVGLIVGVVVYLRSRIGVQVKDHEAKLAAAQEKGDTQAELLELQILVGLEPENQDMREQFARRLEEQGNYGKALSEWRNLVDKDPENVEARLKIAEYAAALNKPSEAGREADEVLRRQPGNAKAHLLKAQSYMGRQLLPEAEAEAEQAVKLDPKNVQGYVTWVRILAVRGDAKKAGEVIETGLKEVPDNTDLQVFAGDWYRDQGNGEKSEEMYKKAIEGAKDKTGPLLSLAMLYAVQGKDAEARGRYGEAAASAPTGPEKTTVLRNYGKYLSSRLEWAEAVKQYDEALKVSPKHAGALADRAWALLAMGRVDEESGEENAKADIMTLLERPAHDEYLVQALFLQGRMLLMKGQIDAAIESLEKSNKENEGIVRPQPTINTTLALAQCYQMKGDTARARDLLLKGLDEQPEDWRVRLMLGQVLESRGEHDKAIATLSGRRAPVEGVLLLARAQANKGDYDSARATLKALMTAKPDELRAPLEMARVEFAAGEYKRVLEMVDELLKNPLVDTEGEKTAVYRIKLGVLDKLERYEEEDKLYQELLKENPKDYDLVRQYAGFLLGRDRFAEGEGVLKEVTARSERREVTDAYLAWYYGTAGKTEEARGEYRRLAEKYPNVATVREQLVRYALAEKDFAEARKYQQELKKLAPEGTGADILEARILMGEKNHVGAAKILEEVVKKFPRSADARYFLAVAETAQGRLPEAVSNMEVVMNLVPGFRRGQELLVNLYFETGQAEKAEPILRTLRETMKTQGSEAEQERVDRIDAMIEAERGRPKEAEKKLREYLKKNPGDGVSWMALGDALLSQWQEAEGKGNKAEAQRQRDEAEKAYLEGWKTGDQPQRALFTLTRFYLVTDRPDEATKLVETVTKEEEPNKGALRDDLASLALLARLYEQKGNTAGSDKVYERIEKVNPGNILGLLARADRLGQAGKRSEATAALEEAVKRMPKDLTIRRRLTGSLVMEKKYEQALAVVDEGMGVATEASDRLVLSDLKASVMLSMMNADGAVALLKKALADAEQAGLTTETTGARYRLGSILEVRGDSTGAMEAFRQVLKIAPDFLDARVGLMRLYAMEGRGPEARLEALETLRGGTAVLPAYLTLGDLSLNSGNLEEAQKQYQTAVEKFPESGLAKRGLGVTYLRQGEKAKGLATLRESLELSKWDFSEMRVVTQALVMVKEYDEAMKILKEGSGKTSVKGGGEFLMGEVEKERKDLTKACGYYEEAVKASPDNPVYVVTLGKTCLANKDYGRTKELAEEMLKKDPRFGDGYQLLLGVYEGQKDVAGEEEVFQRWMKASPNNVPAVNNYAYFLVDQNKASQAMSVMEDLKRKSQGTAEYTLYQPQLLDTEGWIWYSMGDYSKARDVLEKAREVRPRQPEVLRHLGLTYARLAEQAKARGNQAQEQMYLEEAGKMARVLAETEVNDPEQQIGLARQLAMEGKLDEAVGRLRQAIAASGGGARARRGLVEMLVRGGRLDEANRELETLKKDAPEDPVVPVLEVMVLVKRADMMSRPNPTDEAKALLVRAQGILDKAKQGPAESGLLHYTQADLYLRAGKLDEAEASLNETIRQSPEFVDAYLLKIELLGVRGKIPEAKDACLEVLKKWPRHYQAHLNLGNLLLAENKVDEAEQRFRMMAEAFPEAPGVGVHERLGYVLMMKGRREEALREYQEALKKTPGNMMLLQAVVSLDLSLGKSVEAVEEAKRYVEANGTSPEGYAILGQVYDLTGKPADAEEALQKAIQYGPEEPVGYMRLWEHYMRQKQYQLALAQTKKMLDRGVAKGDAWRLQGQCYEVLKDVDNAEASYRAALKESANDVESANNLAWLLLEQRGKVDESIQIGEAAKKVQGNYWPLLDTVGYAYFVKGDMSKATENLERAVELMRQGRQIVPTVLLHSGMALLKSGKTDIGKERVSEALRNDPNLALPDWVKEIVQRKS